MFGSGIRFLNTPFYRGHSRTSFRFASTHAGSFSALLPKSPAQSFSSAKSLPFQNAPQKSFFQMTPFLRPWGEISLSPPLNKFSMPMRSFAVKTVKVPPMADSITEGTIQKWLKKVGDSVQTDELVAQIETDKVVVDIRAAEPGVILEQLAKESETVLVGADLYKMETDSKAAASAPSPKVSSPPKQETQTPKQDAQPKQDTQPPKQDTQAPKQDTQPPKQAPQSSKPAPAPASKEKVPALHLPAAGTQRAREERKVPLNRMRNRIAQRLKGAQNTYAMLTTFNEVDMSQVMVMRDAHKDEFNEKHGVKLGFMSAFVKAATVALGEQPNVNAVIDDAQNCIIYRDYVDISVAVATPTGLVVPVIRDCDLLSFADIEKSIAYFGKKARDNQIQIEEMEGGTFTISNGGVYGSMMGTPIINPPQSAILGMHAITKRAVVVNDQIVIRPMMYLALTYDHRIIDGKDAVTFLKRIKDLIEDPRRMLLA